jgi:hypothetical protein
VWRDAIKAVLGVLGTLAIFIFPPLLPLWLAALFIRRRRRGDSGLPRLPFLSQAGRIVFFGFAFLGLLVVTLEFSASSIFNAVDEHVAPVLAVFVALGLFLIVAADVALQVLAGVAGALLPRRRVR